MSDARTALQFRIIVILLGSFLLIISSYNFIRNITSITDENVFGAPPTPFYITKDIPAIINDTCQDYGKFLMSKEKIRKQVFLYSINKQKPMNYEEIQKIIEATPSDSNLSMLVVVIKDLRTWKDFDYTVKKSDIPEDFIMNVKSTVLIYEVTPGGASDRAGIKPGDVVTRIDGKTFVDAWGADRILRDEKSKKLNYEVMRGERTLTLKVEPALIGIRLDLLSIFIIGLLFIGIGFYLAVKRPYLKAAQLVGLAFLFVGFYFSASYNRYHFDYDVFSVIRYFLLVISIFAGFPLLFHSTLYFPVEKPELIRKHWLWIVPYVLGGGLTIYNVITFIIQKEIFNDVITIIWMGTVSLYIIISKLLYRKKLTKEQKKVSRMINWAFVIFTCGYLSVIFEVTSLLVLGNFRIIFFAILPIAFLYSIGRYRLLEIKIRVSRSVQYGMISTLWKIILFFSLFTAIWFMSQITFNLPNVFFTGTSIEVLDKPLRPELQELYGRVIVIFFAICIFFLAAKISRIVQKVIDRKFYRTRFDYRKASTDFSEIFIKNCCITDLSLNIVNELAELIHVKKLCLILYRNEEKVAGLDLYGVNNEQIKEFCQVTARSLVNVVRDIYSECRVDYLPEPFREVFNDFEFQYIIPIRSKEKLVGVLLLGEKLSEVSYNREDFEFLSSIVTQISVTIENAYLYEDVSRQERFKQELEIARRIQLASLPQKVPEIEGLDIAGISLPAFEVGGDFYDFLNGSPNALTIIVGDVSDKGTSAALYMSKIQGILRTLNEFSLTPKQLIIRANQLLWHNMEKSAFITVLGAAIDYSKKQMTLARAGHMPLYYYNSRAGITERIVPKGVVIGLSREPIFDDNIEEIILDYNSGDVFLFVTDGVTEARNSDDEDYAETRLVEEFAKCIAGTSLAIRDRIVESVREFTEGMEPFDDLTVVVVKVL